MKIYLQGIMLSLLSIVMMTLLTLGISAVSAQEIEQEQAKVTQHAQNELIDLFFAAARTGNNEVIKEFLEHGFPVDVQNQQGFTALMMATYYGHQNTVTTLLEHGANRCVRDQKGHTALMGAIVKAEWLIAKQLKKVDCDVQAKQTGLLTIEEFAKVFGQLDQLKKLDR
ncbi:ankyrin repeat domain-containing protein [Acinetobacter sichuanensis]|uniref:Ankyrin repeat domain-containing protein n=2 Tax=Acinetobacter sichuanensis TaxID=2136183 RepID=A0ABV7B8B7_9GAMM